MDLQKDNQETDENRPKIAKGTEHAINVPRDEKGKIDYYQLLADYETAVKKVPTLSQASFATSRNLSEITVSKHFSKIRVEKAKGMITKALPKAVQKLTALISEAESEETARKAANDILDRQPETSKEGIKQAITQTNVQINVPSLFSGGNNSALQDMVTESKTIDVESEPIEPDDDEAA